MMVAVCPPVSCWMPVLPVSLGWRPLIPGNIVTSENACADEALFLESSILLLQALGFA